MFKPAKIEYLPKMNFRYRLLKVENEWYLMEVDRPIITSYFLPWFTYFVPHKGYQLTEDEVEAIAPKVLEGDKNMLSTQTKVGISTLGAGSLAVLLGRAFPIEDYLYFTSHLLNLVLMIVVLFIVFGIRIWISIGKKVTVIKPSKKSTRMYCRPAKFRIVLRNLLLLIVPLFLSSAMIYSVLSKIEPNLIVHMVLFVTSFIYLASGNLVLYASGDDYKAKVKK
ncbi:MULTISPECIES: DUF443 family protein [unclassified Streptococcus]|uniref:DUF443 family protein n=1 Tax=unclassified Streptococcus TaxID=2608887 RepID=UPI0020C8722F|nr:MULTISPECIES: DUF443 family protein [unclassified Streptococcus]MBS6931589.1 DUF443 family protein [Lachnospiraceae bacterium oral taxon 082]MCP8963271.1 DUF443 family protein [Streptococcus sp. CF8_St5-12]MCP8981171.1 DUF443 family protein [Streptococcus sp. CF8_St5-16]MCP8983204.1 DUF443 family protein [Streptococcus sp. CF8_St5-13]MCP9040194.1 DUF443 family protein [Streptococcus sp. CF8_St5-11]